MMKSIPRNKLSLGFLLSLCLSSQIVASAQTKDEKKTSISVYNQNYALVRQERTFTLVKGLNELNWSGIAKTIDQDSIILQSVNPNHPVSVKEQSYKTGNWNSETILTELIGKTVSLRNFLSNGQSAEQSGILLGFTGCNGLLIKSGDRYILNPPGQIEVDRLPTGFTQQPQLTFKVEASKGGQQDLNLTYIANGINWRCNYTAVINDKQDNLDFTAAANVENHSGIAIDSSSLKLVAGSVQRRRAFPMASQNFNEVAARDANLFDEQSFADYHLYTYDDVFNLNNEENKSLVLLSGKNVAVEKKYVFDQQLAAFVPQKKVPVAIKLEFKNSEENNLGKPMPAGKIRVYQHDAQHKLEFIGEDAIDHTPVGEKISLEMGTAFDITAEKIHTNSEQTSLHKRQDKFSVTFHNKLNHEVTVTDIEHMPYNFFSITADLPYVKINNNTYRFEVKVPASGEATVSYELQARM